MKLFWIIFLVLFGLMFVVALDEPDTGIGEEDYEKIQNLHDDFSPLNERGEVDFNKYKPFKTQADERIDAINLWLSENASWLKVVFGMVPSLTWLFAVNFYVWLVFLVFLVLNANSTFLAIDSLGGRIVFEPLEISWARIFGSVVFLVFLALKYTVILAEGLLMIFDFLWDWVLPIGITAVVISIVAVVILAIMFPMLVLRVLIWYEKRREEKRNKEVVRKGEEGVEVIEKVIEGITQS